MSNTRQVVTRAVVTRDVNTRDVSTRDVVRGRARQLRRRNRRGLRQAVFAAGCTLLLASCVPPGNVESQASDTDPASSTSVAIAPPTQPAPSTPSAPSNTSAPTTAPAPATAPSTLPATAPPTAAPDPCAGFVALDAYGRMLAVRDGSAPTDAACADPVQRAKAGLATMDASQRLYERFGIYADDLVIDFSCDDFDANPVTYRNDFDVPIRAWGLVVLKTEDEETIFSFTPYISDPIAPGQELTVSVPVAAGTPRWEYCRFPARAFIDPSGLLAGDAGLAPSPDDPQASNDGATFVAEIESAGELAEEERSFARQIADVEDVHSPDLFGGTEGFNGVTPRGTTVPPGAFFSRTERVYCETLLQEGEEGQPGELRMIATDQESVGADGRRLFSIGLYRRGSDGLWRYLGRAIVLDVPNAEPCALPLH